MSSTQHWIDREVALIRVRSEWPEEVADSARALNLSLIPFAVSAEILSMATLARLQRRLLRAGGARLSMPSMVVIVYASNAISVSVPIAGSPAVGQITVCVW